MLTERLVAVLVTPSCGDAAPPGIGREEFLRAVAEDTYEMVAGLDLVTPVIISVGITGLEEIAWPGTPVISVDSADQAFAALPPADQAVVVSADAPDLPPLLIGKLFRELGRAEIAVCPSDTGGAVAVAAHLPFPEWATLDVDHPEVVKALRAQAPGPRKVATGPGWHRLRTPDDLARLDPGLEGWDSTRALVLS